LEAAGCVAGDYEVDQRVNWRVINEVIQTRCGVGMCELQAQNQLANSGSTIFSMTLAATVQTAEISGF
jgi:hypothetical protein